MYFNINVTCLMLAVVKLMTLLIITTYNDQAIFKYNQLKTKAIFISDEKRYIKLGFMLF